MFGAPEGVDTTLIWRAAFYATAMNIRSVRDSIFPLLFVVLAALVRIAGHLSLGAFFCFMILGVVMHVYQSIVNTYPVFVKSVALLAEAMPEDSLRQYYDPQHAPAWATATREGTFAYVCGMSRPLDELLRAWPRMVTWKLERQEAFADVVTRATCEQRDWAEEQLSLAIETHRPAGSACSTSIGNLAWMIRHGPSDLRVAYQKLHKHVCDRVKKQHSL